MSLVLVVMKLLRSTSERVAEEREVEVGERGKSLETRLKEVVEVRRRKVGRRVRRRVRRRH